MGSFNITEHLRERSVNAGQQSAILLPNRTGDEFESVSFSELDRYSDLYGEYLIRSGVQRGDTVLMMVRAGVELIGIAFALLKRGIIPILIDPGMGIQNFVGCVKRTQPNYLIGIAPAILLSRIFRSSFLSIRKSFCVNRKTFSKLELHSDNKEPLPIVDSLSSDQAAILFTSGSTGPAKGVCYTFGIFSKQIELVRENFGIELGEIDLPMLPIFALFNPALGMTTVVPPMNPSRPAKANPAKIVKVIQNAKVTNSFGSPVLWNNINRYCDQNEITLPTLKRVLIAGAAVPYNLVESLHQKMQQGQIFTPYGATECLPVCGISHKEILARDPNQGLGTLLGKPLSDVEVRVIQPVEGIISSIDDTVDCEPSQIGEIIVKGDVVTQEYYQLPEKTAEAKIKDGEICWHRIGDLGYFDRDGYLWFAGRKVEQIVSGDRIYYTDFVEKWVNQHPHVYRSALLSYELNGQKRPAIGIEPYEISKWKTENTRKVLLEDIRNHLKQSELTESIADVFLWKRFPVDVRHNAKIHRITMSRKLKNHSNPLLWVKK